MRSGSPVLALLIGGRASSIPAQTVAGGRLARLQYRSHRRVHTGSDSSLPVNNRSTPAGPAHGAGRWSRLRLVEQTGQRQALGRGKPRRLLQQPRRQVDLNRDGCGGLETFCQPVKRNRQREIGFQRRAQGCNGAARTRLKPRRPAGAPRPACALPARGRWGSGAALPPVAPPPPSGGGPAYRAFPGQAGYVPQIPPVVQSLQRNSSTACALRAVLRTNPGFFAAPAPPGCGRSRPTRKKYTQQRPSCPGKPPSRGRPSRRSEQKCRGRTSQSTALPVAGVRPAWRRQPSKSPG